MGEHPAADRRRADDLAAARRGPHVRAARARAATRSVLDVGTGSGYHAARAGAAGTPTCTRSRSTPRSRARPPRTCAPPASATSRSRSATARAAWRSTRPTRRSTSRPRRAGRSRRRWPTQLAPGGRLVVPVENGDQRLVVARRTPDGVTLTALERVRFVPLVAVTSVTRLSRGFGCSSRPTFPPGLSVVPPRRRP